jgi:hypothetical protein
MHRHDHDEHKVNVLTVGHQGRYCQGRRRIAPYGLEQYSLRGMTDQPQLLGDENTVGLVTHHIRRQHGDLARQLVQAGCRLLQRRIGARHAEKLLRLMLPRQRTQTCPAAGKNDGHQRGHGESFSY